MLESIYEGFSEELNLNKILADACALIRFHVHNTDHSMYMCPQY